MNCHNFTYQLEKNKSVIKCSWTLYLYLFNKYYWNMYWHVKVSTLCGLYKQWSYTYMIQLSVLYFSSKSCYTLGLTSITNWWLHNRDCQADEHWAIHGQTLDSCTFKHLHKFQFNISTFNTHFPKLIMRDEQLNVTAKTKFW
jgi:hypothetical protein